MLGSLPILPLPAPPADGNLGPLPLSQVTGQQNNEKAESEEQSNANLPPAAPVATNSRTIGIICPPPDIRSVVDKTARFVSKLGPAFERRVVGCYAGNVKFNFLSASDPYHAYYQHRLAEFGAQKQTSGQQPPPTSTDDAIIETAPSSAVDPDIRSLVDKTAQFVSKNGPEFERRVVANYAGNVKFNFLSASDPYHAYYQHRLAEFGAQNQTSGQQPPPTSTDDAIIETAPSSAVDPDIRSLVDKTAQFVSKNGPEFERRVVANYAGNVKFNFLSASDPYHAYYQHRLAEFRAQNQTSEQQPPPTSTDML